MAEARATVPELELERRIDAGPLLELAREQGCSRTAILAQACAAALCGSPRANGAYRDGRCELYSRINVAIAVAAGDGLVAPTVLDADTKGLHALSDEVEHLTQRALTGELTPPEQAGATFTLVDLGDLGIDRWSAPPALSHAATLTAGAIRAVPVVRDGGLVAGHELCLTLVCDHRILFGPDAAGFLTRIAQILEGATP